MYGLYGMETDGRTGLETYARLEYGSREAAWLHAAPKSHAPRGGLRAWVGRIGRAARRAGRPADGPGSPLASPRGRDAVDGARARDGCDHEDFQFLGAGGRTWYYRCARCGAPLVVQGSRAWTIRGDRQRTGSAAPAGDEPRGRDAYA